MSAKTYYKVLGKDRRCYHGGSGKWLLPGEWMPKVEGPLVPCENGYHILDASQLIEWLGPEIWIVEPDQEIILDIDKYVTRCARLIKQVETWTEKTARLFAADCVEHVLHFFEEKYPNDNRPRAAIQAARDFANGKISYAAVAAAVAAAWDAARAAAWAAARDAAVAAAVAAAEAAAWDAARAAAVAAAEAAAWDAEKQWQVNKLCEWLRITE